MPPGSINDFKTYLLQREIKPPKNVLQIFPRAPQDGIEVTCAHKPVCWLKPLLHILHVFLLLFQLPFVLGTVCEAT